MPAGPADLDARFTKKNPVFRFVLVGGMIFWAVFFYIHFGLGNFLPVKIVKMAPDRSSEYEFEEIGTGVLYGLGFLLASFLAVTTPGARRRFVLFAAFCFLTFGEEFNWGQQIFHFTSPQFFAEHGIFGETNLHGIRRFRPFYMLFFVALPVGGFLIHLIRRARKKKDQLAICLLWCFAGAFIAECPAAKSFFQFLLSWMIFAYLVLMTHLRFWKENNALQ